TYPGLDASLTSDAVALAQRLLKTSDTTKVAFGTEAGFFDQLGIPTIVCGPGSMAGQGHKADEYIDLAQLVTCGHMLTGVVQELAS
ncbi:MAG: M20/M25/M40 family metallo-hydrolase, partial [Planktomarina sp.]